MHAFYIELARRAVALANALQYERAAQLLCIALDAKDWDEADMPPEKLRDAWGDLHFWLNSPEDVDTFSYFEAGIQHVEAFIEEQPA